MKRRISRRRKSESGSALIAALCLIFIAGMLTASVLILSQISTSDVSAHTELQRSAYINEGVANRVQWLLAAEQNPFTDRRLGELDYAEYDYDRYMADGITHEMDYHGNQLFIFHFQPDENQRTLVIPVCTAQRYEMNIVGLPLEDNTFLIQVLILPPERNHIADAVVHDTVDRLTGFQTVADTHCSLPCIVKRHGSRCNDQGDEDHDRHRNDHFHKGEKTLILPHRQPSLHN